MSGTCAACGKPIYVHHMPYISLNGYWTHYSWWANRSHNAIPNGRNR
ncbi:MAG TPA: hypothetical protein VMV41_08085 [Cellulomonadaceae bacterium]|nr:hypothetical protein [Cellulomonadaceae bacterium]